MDVNRKVELGSAIAINEKLNGKSGWISLSADSISARPFLTITDEKSKESYSIPLDLIDDLAAKAGEITGQYTKARDIAQRETYDPQLILPMQAHLTKKENKEYRRSIIKFCLQEHDIESALTPIISWTSPDYDFQQGNNIYRASGYGGELKGGYWSLYLHGEPKHVLQEVAWDDEVNLKIMVESMTDPESLLAMLGLMNASAATRLSSRMIATELGKTPPSLTVKDVRQMIRLNGLSTIENPFTKVDKELKAKLGTLYVTSQDTKIPVAIAITPSLISKFAAHNVQRREPNGVDSVQWKAQLEADKIENRNLWFAEFTKAIKARGWYSTELSTEKRLIITALAPEVWSKVRVAAEYALPNLNQTVYL